MRELKKMFKTLMIPSYEQFRSDDKNDFLDKLGYLVDYKNVDESEYIAKMFFSLYKISPQTGLDFLEWVTELPENDETGPGVARSLFELYGFSWFDGLPLQIKNALTICHSFFGVSLEIFYMRKSKNNN